MSSQSEQLIRQKLDTIFAAYEENQETKELYLEVQADLKEAVLEGMVDGLTAEASVTHAFDNLGDLQEPLSEISRKKTNVTIIEKKPAATADTKQAEEQAVKTNPAATANKAQLLSDSLNDFLQLAESFADRLNLRLNLEQQWFDMLRKKPLYEQRYTVADWQDLTGILIEQPATDVAIFAADIDEIQIIECINKDDKRFFGSFEKQGGQLVYFAGIRPLISWNLEVYVTIYVPRRFSSSLNIANRGGRTYLQGLEALESVMLENSSGAVKVKQLGFNDFNLRGSSGSFKGQDLKGEQLNVLLSSGSLKLEESHIPQLNLSASSGSIKVADSLTAVLNMEASSGSIKTNTIEAVRLNARTSSGSISLGKTKIQEQWELQANSGTIKFEKLRGRGSIQTTSGTVKGGELQLSGDSRLASTSGTIKVAIDSRHPVNVRSQTNSGSVKIKSEAALVHDTLSDHPQLTLQTTSGTIIVK